MSGISQKKSLGDFTIKSLTLTEINMILIKIGILLSQCQGIGQVSDVHGSRIANVADPEQANDAVNLDTLEGTALSFRTINCEHGTDPVADKYDDTLTLHSLTDTITITGNSANDTISFDLSSTSTGKAISSEQTIDGETALGVSDFAEQFITITASIGSTIISLTAISTGSVVTICAADNNMTITHSSSLVLKGSDDLPMSTGDMITLIRTESAWRERSRTLF